MSFSPAILKYSHSRSFLYLERYRMFDAELLSCFIADQNRNSPAHAPFIFVPLHKEYERVNTRSRRVTFLVCQPYI